MKIALSFRDYFGYKLLNSLFFGVSTGSIFILYAPLEPSLYSVGGIFLAIGLLMIAKFYDKMMNRDAFFGINMLVEVVVLVMVLYFLVFSYSYVTALLIYLGYQLTFMFGSYLVRIETLALSKTKLLSLADIIKQKGYLAGMIIAYVFYKTLGWQGITEKQEQVYYLHFGLLVIQVGVLWRLYRTFTCKPKKRL